MKKLTALLLMGIALHQTQTVADDDNITMKKGDFNLWQSTDLSLEEKGFPTQTATEEDLIAQRTDKLQLYSADDGNPNVGYIQGGKVYTLAGTFLGTYASSLRKTAETDPTWSRLPLYVELVQDNGIDNINTLASGIARAIRSASEAAPNGDVPEGYTGAFTVTEKPDSIYFPVYISDQTAEGANLASTVTS